MARKRTWPPGQMAELRRRRAAKTAANGGVAPASQHNWVTYHTWRCRCARCVASWNAEKTRRRRMAAPTGKLRRPDITVARVQKMRHAGMTVSEIMRTLGCSRDLVLNRLLRAEADRGRMTPDAALGAPTLPR